MAILNSKLLVYPRVSCRCRCFISDSFRQSCIISSRFARSVGFKGDVSQLWEEAMDGDGECWLAKNDMWSLEFGPLYATEIQSFVMLWSWFLSSDVTQLQQPLSWDLHGYPSKNQRKHQRFLSGPGCCGQGGQKSDRKLAMETIRYVKLPEGNCITII